MVMLAKFLTTRKLKVLTISPLKVLSGNGLACHKLLEPRRKLTIILIRQSWSLIIAREKISRLSNCKLLLTAQRMLVALKRARITLTETYLSQHGTKLDWLSLKRKIG